MGTVVPGEAIPSSPGREAARPRLVLVGRDPQVEGALRSPGGPRLVAQLEEASSAPALLAQIRPEVVVALESAAPGEPFAELLAGIRTLLPAAHLVAVVSGALTYDVAGVDELRLPWTVPELLRRAGWGQAPPLPEPPAQAPAPPLPEPEDGRSAAPTAFLGQRESSWRALEMRLQAANGRPRAAVRTLRPQVVALVSVKGGVGKTSLAVNLAALLAARTEARVLLVDLGLEGPDASVQLDMVESPGLVDLLPFAGRLESVEAQSAIRSHPLGFQVVAGPSRPELAQLVDPDRVGRLLRGALSRYDVTLVDTDAALPPSLRFAVCEAATRLFVLSTVDPAALRRLHLALQQEEPPWPRERLHLVLARLPENGPVRPSEAARELGFEDRFELPEAGPALERGAYLGRPLVLEQPDHPFSRAVEQLASRLVPLERSETRWAGRLRAGWAKLSSVLNPDESRRG
ncbi:MAG: AAA family ATPase [Bacillota bacterium]|nr:AAA family ATPase [Bacillota bacterium]